MSPRDGVSVGGIRRMSNDAPPPSRPPGFTFDTEAEDNFQDFFRGFGANFVPAFQAQQLGMGSGQGSFASPLAGRFNELKGMRPTTPLPTASLLGTGSTFLDTVNSAGMNTGRAPLMSAGGVYEPSSAEQAQQLLAMYASQAGGGGGGGRGPDYSQYRQALTGQAEELNARIQAMYNQLAQEAGANVGRIQEVYGGAEQGIGNVYDSATGNVAQAFGSAQQQAADQLARLGIEAAAPAVIDPMALSQAQAVSGLEQGRASGQAAAQRYGATAGGFGSQMAQVAQQQGTEMNAAILAALQQRLNECLLMEQQGRASGGGGGGGNPMKSAMDFLRLQEMIEAPGLARQDLDMRAAQIAADNRLSERDKILSIATDIRNDYESEAEALQAATAMLQEANRALGLG